MKPKPLPQTGARVSFSVEAVCPYCEHYNRYHDLSGVHGSMKRVLDEKKDAEYVVGAKCQQCERPYQIVKHKIA